MNLKFSYFFMYSVGLKVHQGFPIQSIYQKYYQEPYEGCTFNCVNNRELRSCHEVFNIISGFKYRGINPKDRSSVSSWRTSGRPTPAHPQVGLLQPHLASKDSGESQRRLRSPPAPLPTACCQHCETPVSVLRHQHLAFTQSREA